jgi:hypothetical protein
MNTSNRQFDEGEQLSPSLQQFLGTVPLQRHPSMSPEDHTLIHRRQPEIGDLFAVANLRQIIGLMDVARTAPPLFVSYYTANTPYEALADRLRVSLDQFRLPHRIEPITSLGNWVANTGLKSTFIKKAWDESDGPICWVDADAEIIRPPTFVFDNPCDFAVVRRHGWYDISSFVYLNKTRVAGRLVARWAELCAENPHIWDQVLLTLAWYQVTRAEPIDTFWLHDGVFRFPRPWLRDLRDRLFYYPLQRKMRPFIDQKQASRSLKAFVDGSKAKRPDERGSDNLALAFRQALINYDFGFDANARSIFREG